MRFYSTHFGVRIISVELAFSETFLWHFFVLAQHCFHKVINQKYRLKNYYIKDSTEKNKNPTIEYEELKNKEKGVLIVMCYDPKLVLFLFCSEDLI